MDIVGQRAAATERNTQRKRIMMKDLLRSREYHHREREKKMITPESRLSSAQRTIGALSPVTVSFAPTRSMDHEEMRRMSARVLNLQMLLKEIFGDSIATLAAHLEMAPERLRALLDLQAPFTAEIAEHLEKSLRLPGGWLDNKRSGIDAEYLRSVIFATGEGEDSVSTASSHSPSAPASAQAAANEAQQPTQVAPQPHEPRVFLAQDVPKKAEPTTADNACQPAQASHDNHEEQPKEQPMSAAGQTHATQNANGTQTALSVETISGEPVRQTDALANTLRWLNNELDRLRAPNGMPARAALRVQLGRAQSTVSTWLNGLRKVPDDMVIPLARAVIDLRLPIAREFLERMFQACPSIFNEPAKRALLMLLDNQPPTTQEAAPHLAPHAAPATAARTAVPVNAAPVASPVAAPSSAQQPRNDAPTEQPQAYATPSAAASAATVQPNTASTPTSSAQQLGSALTLENLSLSDFNSAEVKLVVARATEKLADVLQRLMRS